MSKRMRDWLATIPPEVRDPLIRMHTGTNLAYVLKRVYTAPPDQLPTFKIRIAVGLDKASRGQLDFREMVAGGKDIDWDFVRKELDRRRSVPAPVAETATETD
jgi:hypothetical protein